MSIRVAGKYILCFIGIVIAELLLLTGVFLVPDELVQSNVDDSLYIVRDMESWIWFGNFFGVPEGRLDMQTDEIMLGNALRQNIEMNAIQSAMSVNQYERYWHGYLIWLRPLLTRYNYWQIRYMNMVVFYVLLSLVIGLTCKRVGGARGIAVSTFFTISLVMCYIVVIPVSLQYFSVFLIVECTILLLLIFTELNHHMTMFIVGMVTSFVDFLTAPLLTLGLPLIYIILLDHEHGREESIKKEILRIIELSILWGTGYALNWLAKWIIGSIVLENDVFSSVNQHAQFWVSDGNSGSRLLALKLNFQYYFIGQGIRSTIPVLIPLAVLFVYMVRHLSINKRASIYLLIAIMPYIWYLLMNGHSFYHAWFTYRAQAITLFGISLFLIEQADWSQFQSGIISNNRKGM